MVYCINPLCTQRQNPQGIENCLACGNSLLINGRIRLLRPLISLGNQFTYTDVFEVEDTGSKAPSKPEIRVMKVLKWSDDNKIVQLFQREAIILQILNHPGIPKSTRDDYFTFTLNNKLQLHCIVMQLFEGENLTKWIKNHGRINQHTSLDWLFQLANILDTVHRSGFFHRDIKPDNIIYQPDGKLALVDFGAARQITRTYLAKVSTSGGTKTGLGSGHEITVVRTACYSPWEQLHGQAVPQSDFFALGRTFVYLLTAIPLIEIKIDQTTGKLLWRNKAPQIEKPFADFIDELMATLPGKRPQTTQVILQRLERIPLQSKINRIVKSKPFGIGAVTLVILSFIGLHHVLRPVVADYLMYQGRKAQQENRFDDALKRFRDAVNTDPALADSVSKFYVEQAWAQDITPEDARKYYELAIKFNPKNDSAYNNLGLLCQKLRDVECVNNSYAAVFKLKPDKWEAHYGLGNFYDDLGKYDLAEKHYRLAIQSSDLALDAVSNLARIKNLQGEYNEAINTVLQGLRKAKDPGLKAALYKSIGWAKLEQGKYREAKSYLEKAQNLDPQRTDTYCLLAKTQEALGNIDSAWAWWEPCMLLNSNLPEVIQWRISLLERIKLLKGSQAKNKS
ncbi:tetratricopeptide repeat protein [Nostoc sp. FACHB-152]|uniref:protein kinase domain-containing protein n=1 Tax=unclassified Nostoc TaxID=2593658 RepID=UPI0016893926|nr:MULTISPECIES: tetratricopeptide repeat protein [unclassified Nostoc]MBD2452370.1 tetratricopeptide repeat protein [Nostoc sp. FACHB-152]MBD2472980.1 tetratricopeptide repeat protein [Nostoc sp. FACHB-145]